VKRKTYVLAFSVGLFIVLSTLAALLVVGNPSRQGPTPNSINVGNAVGITPLKVPPPVFLIEGSKVINYTVSPGGNVTGSVTLQILNPQPIGVYLNDLGYNGSSTLPEGISVEVMSGGVQFSLERLSVIISVFNAQSPLIQTSGLTQLPITYIIHVSDSVNPGTYDVALYFVSFQQGQMSWEATLTVVLYVQ